MNNRSETIRYNTSIAENYISCLFGILVFAVGVINTFWGNDLGFGLFLVLLSLIYFLPVNLILKKIMGWSIPRIGIVKVILAIFIVIASLGVGELFAKIDLMIMDLN